MYNINRRQNKELVGVGETLAVKRDKRDHAKYFASRAIDRTVDNGSLNYSLSENQTITG